MIRCSAPLPEGSPDPVLARMLEHALYQVPSGEDKGRDKEAKSGPHALLIQTGGISVSAKEDNRGEESKIPSPHGKKMTTSEDLERRVSKRGKKPSPGGPAPEGVLAAQCPQGGPTLHRAVSESRVLLVNISFFISEDNDQDIYLAVRLVALLNRVRLRGIFFRG